MREFAARDGNAYEQMYKKRSRESALGYVRACERKRAKKKERERKKRERVTKMKRKTDTSKLDG